MTADDPAVKADPSKTHLVAELKHSSPVVSCRFDPTGKFLVAGMQDASVQRFDLAGSPPVPLARHDSWVRGLAFSPAGDTLFTGGFDGRLVWWPLAVEKPEPIRVVDAHTGWIRAIATSPDGQWVASCGNDQVVKVWSAADGAMVQELSGHGTQVFNAAFHPTGEFLATGDLKGIVRQWRVATWEMVRQFDGGPLYKFDSGFQADIGGIRGIDHSGDGKELACGGITNVSNAFAGVGNPLVIRFNLETGAAVQQHRVKADLNATIWGLAYHPDGFLISVCGGTNGGVMLFWSADQVNETFRFALPNTGRDMDLHPDGLRVAVAHHDKRVGIYRMADGS